MMALYLITALLLTASAHAQDKISEIDKIFSWASPSTPGCAVAVSVNGKLVANRGYGSADLERDVPITPATIFDAGSLRKQFIAASVLLLVEDKRLSLSSDIRKYIPELPDTGHTITVDHLLTHTSGIRDWTAMLPLASGSPDVLTLILRQRGLNFAPGEEWSYSNSGYVLALEIVARASGMSFAEFTRKRLFEPLQMKSTAYIDDMRGVIRNRALAYDMENGRWRLAMLLDNNRGGGGVLTTAADLIIWNDALSNNRLGAFVSEKIQEPAQLNNGRKLAYARGLFVGGNRGGKSVWHTGSADGYKSWLGRFPESGLSLALLCNSGDEGNRTMSARRVLDLFVPPAAGVSAVANSPAGPVESSKAGLFFSDGAAEPLRLSVNGNRLAIAGGPTLVMVAKDRFRNPRGDLSFMSQDEFELTFLSNNELELKSMEGRTTRYRRAEPYAPTADELKAFTGRYESDEIGSVFRIAAGEGALIATLEHSPARRLPFRPVDRDAFQASRVMLRFQRDPAGKVAAFVYSNPLVRGVKFTRLSDGVRPR